MQCPFSKLLRIDNEQITKNKADICGGHWADICPLVSAFGKMSMHSI